MALGFTDIAGEEITAQGVMGSLRCANPACNAVVAQAHLMGMGIIRILACGTCGRGSEYENTPRGWTVRMLAKRPAVSAKR